MTGYEQFGGTATYWPTAQLPSSGRAHISYLVDDEGARAIYLRCSWEWRP